MRKKVIKEKTHNIIDRLKNECKDWKTLIVLICVIAIMYSPVWLGYLLYYIFKWNWCIVMGAVTFAFWFGPFTPFFPLCIAITLFIKKIMQVKKRKKGEQNYER